jgi:hypothetical protein
MNLLSPVSVLMCSLLVTAGVASSVCKANAEQPEAALAGAFAQGSPTAPTVTGTWKFDWIDKSGDAKQGTMQLTQNGSAVTGSFKGDHGPFAVVGTLQGNQISLTVKAPMHKVSFSGTVDGGKMSGSTETGKTWTAILQ